MACRVVTVSRPLGAGGEEVAALVAEQLGFRYMDEEIIARAADRAAVSPESMSRVEESPGLIARILESMAHHMVAPEPFAAHQMTAAATTELYEALIERVIREVANEGGVVIVAHAASIPLAGTPGLLRVLVTGSPEARAERVAREAGLEAKAARKAVDESDRQRRDYLRRFYDVREELPTHYDLVVSTDVLSPAQAAQAVLALAA